MERITSFKESEFHVVLLSAYRTICNSAKSAALLHVNTKEKNNPYHFESVVVESNKAILKLKELYSKHNGLRKDFILLNQEELIKEAEEFFQRDIY